MKYQFGDGAESPLSFNYLEYLRLALTFAASVLRSQTNIASLYVSAKKKKLSAKNELKSLATLRKIVDTTLDNAASRISLPTASECVDRLRGLGAQEIDATEARLRAALSEDLEFIQSKVDGEYAENVRRLERVLLSCDFPESERWFEMRPFDENGYDIELITASPLAVDAVIRLGVPEGHLLSRPLRVDAVDPDLTVNVPQSGGWTRKNVKIKPHKLGKEYVVAFSHTTEGKKLSLRSAFLESSSGYDLLFGAGEIRVSWISKQQENEPFAADPEDVAGLTALLQAVEQAMDGLADRRQMLKQVFFESTPLQQHTEPIKLVKAMIDEMGPVVQEIAAHTLSPRELTLKRVLGDDRREEIFVSVEELKQIYADLPEKQQHWFAPLGFDAAPAPGRGPAGPSSRPPRPASMAPPPPSSASVPPPFSALQNAAKQRSSEAPSLPKPSVPPASAAPAPAPAPEPEPEPKPEPETDAESEPEPTIEVDVDVKEQ